MQGKHKCHTTSEYRGCSQVQWNLNYQLSTKIPVIMHNLKSYDSHFLIKEVVHKIEGEVSIVPQDFEKYITFSKKVKNTNVTLQFLDSLNLLSPSLDELGKNLNDDEFKILRANFSNINDDESFNLFRKKVKFPYEYTNSY